MKFPNKVISYNESIISKFPMILTPLKIRDYDAFSLYTELSKKMTISEFINALECLYILDKVILSEGVIQYVD